tara:strand:- start:183 stop:332 length:150 start_codon:yes stop_codon:yes gene_type:complete
MIQGKEFKVIIKENGHILYNGQIIALLAEWTKYEDLDPDYIINQTKGKK